MYRKDHYRHHGAHQWCRCPFRSSFQGLRGRSERERRLDCVTVPLLTSQDCLFLPAWIQKYIFTECTSVCLRVVLRTLLSCPQYCVFASVCISKHLWAYPRMLMHLIFSQQKTFEEKLSDKVLFLRSLKCQIHLFQTVKNIYFNQACS